MLKIERVDDANAQRLVQYCAVHGAEHDESYLPGRDFAASPAEPAYLLMKDRQVAGAVALLRLPRYLNAGKGRFAIFHSNLNSTEAYTRLFEAIRPHLLDLRSAYLFIPQARQATAAILTHLGFHIERYSYLLVNRHPGGDDVRFPDGFVVEPLTKTHAAGIEQFARCINDSFADLAGHLELFPDDVRAFFDDEAYLEGGICLLRHGGQAVGTLCITREHADRDVAEVSGLGVSPSLQGRGLGRMLLRYAGAFAVKRGLPSVALSVNAENESALGLYQSEGFELTDTVVCYSLEPA